MNTLFFSYSHRDETLRDELEIHLSTLKRQGVIETWHDRRIIAGEEVRKEISNYLAKADVILLLVSPYFLASDYCYHVEMTFALERHQQGEARVIPVIFHPCEWQQAPFGHLLATPTDGKPISKFPNQHDAFLEVTQAIRKAVASLPRETTPPLPRLSKGKGVSPDSSGPIQARSSNLRIRKQFTDHDRDQFQDATFEYLANFFEQSLSELQARNADVETRFKRVDANHFSAAVYVAGTSRSRCNIYNGGQHSCDNSIRYAIGDGGQGGGFNESLRVVDDGHSPFLKSLGMMIHPHRDDALLTQQGAAEIFWGAFIEPLQR